MRARLPDRFDQLFYDVAGRVLIRVAHAEIDDVPALRTEVRLQPVYLGEHIRRQALDAIEFFGLGHGAPLGRSEWRAL